MAGNKGRVAIRCFSTLISTFSTMLPYFPSPPPAPSWRKPTNGVSLEEIGGLGERGTWGLGERKGRGGRDWGRVERRLGFHCGSCHVLYCKVKKIDGHDSLKTRSNGQESEIVVRPPWGASIIPLDSLKTRSNGQESEIVVRPPWGGIYYTFRYSSTIC
jgi:hypothetical protein